jgi:hypothetical protein
MKYVLIAMVAVALCWIGINQLNKATHPVDVSASSPAVSSNPIVKAAPPTPPPKPPVTSLPPTTPLAPPATAPATTVAASTPATAWPVVPWPNISSPVVEPGKPSGPPAPLLQIVLSEVLGPNNLYHDDAFGVSATYPEGWRVSGASRWGVNNSENTVGLVPDTEATAHPSMYYQMYTTGYPEIEGVEAYFQRVAQNKENQRIASGVTDYKNVPSSFEVTQSDGNPVLSYFAVYTRGDVVQTEYFVRVLGTKGYVMFFVPGSLDDVQAIMPQIKKMASTVKVP